MEADRVTWKISIIGPVGTGKSSLISRIVYDSDSAIGLRKQVARKKMILDYMGNKVNADLLFIESEDGAEGEKLVSGSNAIIATADLTNRKSLSEVDSILDGLDRSKSSSVRIAVGTKLDRKYEAVLWDEDFQELEKKHGIRYFFVSARDAVSVNEMMKYVIDELLKRFYAKRKKDA